MDYSLPSELHMKNFPHNIDGPKVTWHKKVNDVIRTAKALETVEDLVDLLGYPDKVERLQHVEQDTLEDDTWMSFYFGDLLTECIFIYLDPFREDHRHCFGIRNGKVEASWRTSVAEQEDKAVSSPLESFA